MLKYTRVYIEVLSGFSVPILSSQFPLATSFSPHQGASEHIRRWC